MRAIVSQPEPEAGMRAVAREREEGWKVNAPRDVDESDLWFLRDRTGLRRV